MSEFREPIRRVFLIVWWFDRFGGMEEHVTALACALKHTGIDVVVFSEMPLSRSNVYAQRLTQNGIPFVAPPSVLGALDAAGRIVPWHLRRVGQIAKSIPIFGWRAWRRLASRRPNAQTTRIQDLLLGSLRGNLTSTFLVGALEREIRRRRAPDVVHVHGCRLGQAWVLRWADIHGIPSVYTEHVNIVDWAGPAHPFSPELVCRAADALASVSEQARSSLQAILPEPRPIRLTRHIVSSKGLSTTNRPEESSRATRLVSIARLEPHKGIDFLLRAFAVLAERRPETRLTIVGDGADRHKLERLAAELGLTAKVAFFGKASRDQVAHILDQADVAVIPSLTEGLPVSVLEALARGIPVIASRVGGIPEVVQDRVNGLLVPPADVGALAGALEFVVGDPASRLQLAQSARRIFRTMGLDEEVVVAGILDLYGEAKKWRADRAPGPEISSILGS